MKQKRETEIVIDKMTVGLSKAYIIGDTPLIYNAMSAKVRHELLFPAGKKTAADKAQKMKHDPLDEYRSSVYARSDDDGPTRLVFPAAAFKSAICNAALEIPGAKKAQIGRLAWVMGDTVDVYGVPQLLMSVVRSADMNKTPDVRTRAILPRWACAVQIRYVMPTLNETAMARLLETAGMVIGLGDFRQEKGKGNYGQFHLVQDKAEYDAVCKAGGRKDQDKALANPACYDRESQELLAWFDDERKRRGR